jgi:hypothetical protein
MLYTATANPVEKGEIIAIFHGFISKILTRMVVNPQAAPRLPDPAK